MYIIKNKSNDIYDMALNTNRNIVQKRLVSEIYMFKQCAKYILLHFITRFEFSSCITANKMSSYFEKKIYKKVLCFS